MFIDDAVSCILLLFIVIFLIQLARLRSSLDDFFPWTDHSTGQNTSYQTSWALRVRRGAGDSEPVGASSWKWFSTQAEKWVPGEVTVLDSVFRAVVFSAIWVASFQVVARMFVADALHEVGSWPRPLSS
jgi:hypothetical protein